MAYKTKYTIQNLSKYIGDPTKIICRSLWERRVCRYMDENKNIIQDSGEIGTFDLGNLKITINSLTTYEKDLIICEK